jgi:hypothetical protein
MSDLGLCLQRPRSDIFWQSAGYGCANRRRRCAPSLPASAHAARPPVDRDC